MSNWNRQRLIPVDQNENISKNDIWKSQSSEWKQTLMSFLHFAFVQLPVSTYFGWKSLTMIWG